MAVAASPAPGAGARAPPSAPRPLEALAGSGQALPERVRSSRACAPAGALRSSSSGDAATIGGRPCRSRSRSSRRQHLPRRRRRIHGRLAAGSSSPVARPSPARGRIPGPRSASPAQDARGTGRRRARAAIRKKAGSSAATGALTSRLGGQGGERASRAATRTPVARIATPATPIRALEGPKVAGIARQSLPSARGAKPGAPPEQVAAVRLGIVLEAMLACDQNDRIGSLQADLGKEGAGIERMTAWQAAGRCGRARTRRCPPARTRQAAARYGISRREQRYPDRGSREGPGQHPAVRG